MTIRHQLVQVQKESNEALYLKPPTPTRPSLSLLRTTGEKVGQQKAVEIFEIVMREGMLPQKLEDLVPLSFFGQAAVNFFRSKIKLMDRLQMTEEQRKITLRDGQQAGELLLDIEARIGELLPSPEEAMSEGGKAGTGIPKRGPVPKVLPEGISSRRAQECRLIKDFPDVVRKMKDEARLREDLVSRRAVIKEIERERVREWIENNTSNPAPMTRLEIAREEQSYKDDLDTALYYIPPRPPERLTEGGYEVLKSLWDKIFIRRKKFQSRFQDGEEIESPDEVSPDEQYLLGLHQALMSIPTKPPEHWKPEALEEARKGA